MENRLTVVRNKPNQPESFFSNAKREQTTPVPSRGKWDFLEIVSMFPTTSNYRKATAELLKSHLYSWKMHTKPAGGVLFQIRGLTPLSACHLLCPAQPQRRRVLLKRYSTIWGWAGASESNPALADETRFSCVCLVLWHLCLPGVCLLEESPACTGFWQPPRGAAVTRALPRALGEAAECHLSLFSHNFSDVGFGLDTLTRTQ